MSFKNYKITALIAARMGSSRFPGKTMSDLCGKPMIAQLILRVKNSQYIDDVLVATTTNKEDDDLEKWCLENSIKCYRGSASDVLGRIVSAINYYEIKTIVEILGDNPLVDSSLIDKCIEKFFYNQLDYVATLTNEYPLIDSNLNRFPIGVRAQVINSEILIKSSKLALKKTYREHATSFIIENYSLFKTDYVTADEEFINCNYPDLSFAVNVPANLELIKRIFNLLYKNNSNFNLYEAIKAFNSHPNWEALMGNNAILK